MNTLTKEEYFRNKFYKEWGTYENYLKNKPPKKKKKKSNFILKLSFEKCPKCNKECEAVVQKFRFTESWFPIGFNCKCGFKQKAIILNPIK